MSWYISVSGKTSKLSEVIKDKFEQTSGCPKDTAEEAAKNALGAVAETLCKSFMQETVVTITASGSAWNESGKARSQACEFKFSTNGDFVE